MLKVSKLLIAVHGDPFYEFNDATASYEFTVTNCSFEGGYVIPANRSGHPDNWDDGDSENPEVTASMECTVYPEGISPEEAANKPVDFVIEVVKDQITSPAGLPPEVASFVGDVLESLIEDEWDPYDKSQYYDGPDYDGPDDGGFY